MAERNQELWNQSNLATCGITLGELFSHSLHLRKGNKWGSLLGGLVWRWNKTPQEAPRRVSWAWASKCPCQVMEPQASTLVQRMASTQSTETSLMPPQARSHGSMWVATSGYPRFIFFIHITFPNLYTEILASNTTYWSAELRRLKKKISKRSRKFQRQA